MSIVSVLPSPGERKIERERERETELNILICKRYFPYL